MPGKKKKFNARFPPARIKKIMQTDEDVGKVAVTVPVVISRALELFIESLVSQSYQVTKGKNAKTLSAQHIKQVILSEQKFDFLKDQVANIPDVHGEEEGGDVLPRQNSRALETSSNLHTNSHSSELHDSSNINESIQAQYMPNAETGMHAVAKSSSSAPDPTQPKRRGRPKKIRPENEPYPVPKKRGRKPKASTEQNNEPGSSAVSTEASLVSISVHQQDIMQQSPSKDKIQQSTITAIRKRCSHPSEVNETILQTPTFSPTKEAPLDLSIPKLTAQTSQQTSDTVPLSSLNTTSADCFKPETSKTMEAGGVYDEECNGQSTVSNVSHLERLARVVPQP